jgi:hypothetical protein
MPKRNGGKVAAIAARASAEIEIVTTLAAVITNASLLCNK